MINKETIEEVKNRLVKVYNPLAIYLFGSYVWGTPTEDSDLDLLIVVDKSDEKSYKRPIIGHNVLFGLDVSKDLIVYTREEFEKRSKDVTTLCHKIKRDGELIYARA
jgi:predicted nucleotidyltransferase